jgi:hypothetical protein
MDAMIQQTISGYTGVFAAFMVSDENLKNEIENFKNELNALGESCADVMDFMTKFPASGLQEKYSDLIARASAPPAPQENSSGGGTATKALPSVKDFLEQFRVSYNAVQNAGYRKRAEKAYENIFAVAERTDDLLEMNIILEREQLLWKIVSEDFIDIYEPILAATDVFNDGIIKQFEKLIQVCKDSTCDEELSYLTDVAVQENQQYNYRFQARMTASIILTGAVLGYSLCKTKFRSWMSPQADLAGLVAQREAAKKIYEYFIRTFGWDFDYFVNDEWMKIWLLVPQNIDANGRIKKVLDPQNLDVMRELLFNEILTNRSIDDILLNEQENVFYFLLDNRADEVEAKYQAEAAKINADLIFFQYLDRLQSAAGEKNVKIPENKDKKSGLAGLFKRK